MKVYERRFVNPLLALAFKDGMEYVNDPDYRVYDPKREGNEWVVLIEDQCDDDDDTEASIVAEVISEKEDEDDFSKLTFNQFLERTKHNMEPVAMRPAPGEDFSVGNEMMNMEIQTKPIMSSIIARPAITNPARLLPAPEKTININDPLKLHNFLQGIDPGDEDEASGSPCGNCIPCKTGQDCIVLVNAACKSFMNFGKER